MQNCVILHTVRGGGVLLNNSNCGGIDPQWTRSFCKNCIFLTFRVFRGFSMCQNIDFWSSWKSLKSRIFLLDSFAKIDFFEKSIYEKLFFQNNSIKKFIKINFIKKILQKIFLRDKKNYFFYFDFIFFFWKKNFWKKFFASKKKNFIK